MFEKVFIEHKVKDSQYTLNILKKVKTKKICFIDSIDDIWGRAKKPYLQKRQSLNLFIGKKNGMLVKEAPDAYGLGNEKHFYYVHAYNCIYECQYCYLQGYFNTPDIVLYVNHDEIIKQMQQKVDIYKTAWFHAGEYSDSLALSHYTNELEAYFEFFKKNTQAKLELRTKSVNTKLLETLKPLKNIYVSFSLSSHQGAKLYDNKCPSIKARIKSLSKLFKLGYNIGIHFDPIVYSDNFEQEYKEVISELSNQIELNKIQYFSIGVVRYTQDVYKEVQQNYPKSQISIGPYVKSFDGKIRYNRPMRNWIMNKIRQLLIDKGARNEVIYLCME
ncbi:MAG: hypothetical protein N4A33_02380 [Bacteriovoracaceae bacterium]|jgi:spore photoproduct lyase|nr:hypothetical protein [Bacteriovoracaceae bacterium]